MGFFSLTHFNPFLCLTLNWSSPPTIEDNFPRYSTVLYRCSALVGHSPPLYPDKLTEAIKK